MRKFTTIIITAILICSAIVLVAIAADKSGKETVTQAGEAVVTYPANVVKESVNTVGTAAQGVVETVVGTVEATGETLTGNVESAPKIVTTPVEGSFSTVSEAAVNTVEIPVTAAEETKPVSK